MLYADPTEGKKWIEASPVPSVPTVDGYPNLSDGDGTTLDTRYVKVAGSTMIGQLGLPGGGSDTQALQKQEVEGLIKTLDDGLDARYVDIDGDTMLGPLALPGGGGATQALQKQEVEALITDGAVEKAPAGDASQNISGNLTLGTDKITLDATDGSAEFAGGITFGTSDTFSGGEIVATPSTELNGKYNNYIAFNRPTDGTSAFRIGYQPDIIKTGDNYACGLYNSSGNGGDIHVALSGLAGLDSNSFNIYSLNLDQVTAQIFADGSANFGGDATITSTHGEFRSSQSDGSTNFVRMRCRGDNGQSNIYINSDAATIDNGEAIDVRKGGERNFAVNNNGQVLIGSDLVNNNALIDLQPNGTASFAGTVSVGDYIRLRNDTPTLFIDDKTDGGNFQYSNGINIHLNDTNFNESTLPVFWAADKNGSNQRVALFADGSASFAGGLTQILSDGYFLTERNNANGTLPAFKVVGKVGGAQQGRLDFACNGELKINDSSNTEKVTLRPDGSASFAGTVDITGSLTAFGKVIDLMSFSAYDKVSPAEIRIGTSNDSSVSGSKGYRFTIKEEGNSQGHGLAIYSKRRGDTDLRCFRVSATNGDANVAGDFTANNVTFNLEVDNPDNYTTTTEEYTETETYEGPRGNTLEREVTKTREIKTYTGPTLDVKEKLLAYEERFAKQDAVIAQMAEALKKLGADLPPATTDI